MSATRTTTAIALTALVATLCATAIAACTKEPSSAAPARSPRESKALPPLAPQGPAATATRSEQVSLGAAQSPCPDDACGGAKRAPGAKLDARFVHELLASAEGTAALIEEGVILLEANLKTPDKAHGALEAFRNKEAARITSVHKTAADLRKRLVEAGYADEMPAEIKDIYEKRMERIHLRLEAVRKAYASRTDVITSFNALFPHQDAAAP